VRGAIVGFGAVAQHGHWPAYVASPGLSIVAVVDRTAERRRLAEMLRPRPRTYESLDALAAAETIEFIDICTPPALHAEPMLDAMRHGWHVVCEKPFLLDAAVAARVRACAVERRLAVVPVHNWKHAPIVRDATERLRGGVIGRLERVDIEVERLRDFIGADPDRPNWRRDPAVAGGGILMDHGWHAVYLALHWFAERPCAVDARFHRPDLDAVEDEADVRLTFPNGEASIGLTWNGSSRRNTMRLSGDAGTIALADDRLIVRSAAGAEDVRYPQALSTGSHHADWYAAFLPQLGGFLSDPESSRAEFDEAAACLDIIHGAYQSGAVSTQTSST
jgi:predicted dehydrogenase